MNKDMDILSLIGRSTLLLARDIRENSNILKEEVENNSFLVIGGAGTIGRAVTKELFKRNPKKLHIVDISENNLVELVRDIRSSYGYIKGDFKTFAIDCGSIEFEVLYNNEGPYDYVLNLSALKHVRSEKDPYTLMRLIKVNILNTIKTINIAIAGAAKKYFCVSTDKAANPVNMMGASKRIMEMFLIDKGEKISVSMARFANVAFSDGSLLYGFNQRLAKKQPIAAPMDVKRYFITSKEAGELCLISTILGNNTEIVFPKLTEELNLITFKDIAEKYLRNNDYEPFICKSEDEARKRIHELIIKKKWPCYFFKSDTTGEKDFEEFFTNYEDIDFNRFHSLGIVVNSVKIKKEKLFNFMNRIDQLQKAKIWTRKDLVELFYYMIPNFKHKEKDRYLDSKM